MIRRHPRAVDAASTSRKSSRSFLYRIAAALLPVSLLLYLGSLTMDVAVVRTTIGLLSASKTTEEPFRLLGTIRTLYERGDWFLVVAITAFTIVFPVGKYLALGVVLTRRDPARSRWLTWIKNLGQWSMGDVFVVALIVVIVRINSGFANVQVGVEPGLYVFAASVLTSMIVSTFLSFEPSPTQSAPAAPMRDEEMR